MAFSTEWRVVENYNGYGGTWHVIGLSELGFRVEDDGTISNLFLAAASPQGGSSRAVSNYPAFQRGPRGFAPTFVMGTFIPLADGDATEPFMDIRPIAEETEISGPVYEVSGALRMGPKGDDGAAILTPGDYGDPQFGQVLSVAPGETDLELSWPKVTGLHLPTTISSAPGGSSAEWTMATIDVPAGTYNRPWRPSLRGYATTVGAGGTGNTGTDIRVDVIVRLNDETGGNIIGRGRGLAGQKSWQPNLVTKVETGSNVIAAGDAATLYVRTKKMSGSATYSADQADAAFEMVAIPA